MKHTVCLVIEVVILMVTGCAHLTELEIHGPSAEKLDIVLVPSHYYGESAGINAQWIADAEAFKKKLLEHHFWIKYRDKINMYRLDVSTGDDFHMQGEYWVPDNQRIKAFALEEVPFLNFSQNDQIVYVIESDGYQNDPLRNPNIGITRGDPNITRVETSYIGSLVHEFGHAFGNLGDEYPKRVSNSWESNYPNIATEHPDNRCEDKWADLMSIVIEAPGTWIENSRDNRTVGCYQSNHPDSEGTTYKPTKNACIMDQINDSFPFCPVCQRHLVTLLELYSPHATCNVLPGKFRNRASFEQAAGAMTLINFDIMPNGSTISAPSPGVLAESRYSSAGIRFTSGVIFGEPNLPFNGISPPNVISNTGINLSERALVSGYIPEPVCAIGITNTGSVAVLRIYDASFRLLDSINSDADPNTKDFIGILSTKPIHRFEFDFVSGIGFSGDDLLVGAPPPE